MMFSLLPARSTRGFTLVEALVAISVFAIIMTIVSQVVFNAFSIDRKTQVSRTLYEEARIAVERIAKEMRRGTVDYEEYFSWYHAASLSMPVVPAVDSDYGANYGWYASRFYRTSSSASPAGPTAVTRFHENVGMNSTTAPLDNADTHDMCNGHPNTLATSGYEQCQLFIISADGTQKTIIRLRPENVSLPDGTSTTEHRLVILQLMGEDTDGDGQVDDWSPLPEFAGYAFQLMQPDTVNITSLSFFISPLEDPRKSFADFADDIQIQPHVTLRMTAEPSGVYMQSGRRMLQGIRGEAPEITIQTTITARAQGEVTSL